ncbi:hypothetical protein PSTT_06738 [Puccinia striiformis]|uniref:Uncharacterized protein n=1 Tax=Puccinia striiformis TaxID=27350 RepID=A0A2S4VJ32_9BASI|nr:hypothetical protein PSTT_06738 [Puccinia striiformis]
MATVIKKRSSTPEQFTQPARVANDPEPIQLADVTLSSLLEKAAPAVIPTPVRRWICTTLGVGEVVPKVSEEWGLCFQGHKTYYLYAQLWHHSQTPLPAKSQCFTLFIFSYSGVIRWCVPIRRSPGRKSPPFLGFLGE